MKALLSELGSQPIAEGFGKVKVANHPEKEAYRKKLVEGIPINKEDYANFRQIARMLRIDEGGYSLLFGG